MIKRIVHQMLTAQILSALTVSLCLLIDNIMIGRFLGEDAIAAYGLANPILLVIGAVGSMLAAGIQVACSKSLGKGSQADTNAGYSSAIVLAAIISLTGMLAVLLLRGPVATLMGAGTEGELYQQTKGYLAGFIIGAPGSMGALILVPFMQMAGQSNLLIAAVLSMTVADVGLDLLNVLVFHGGMFGMGLASSLSYYIAMAVGAVYFLSKKCVFRFSMKQVTRKKIAELATGGVPSLFTMASTVLLIFIMNRILMNAGGKGAVAAFTVITTIGNASNCISTGMGGVSLTLSGILYNEEDRTGLRELLKLLTPRSVLLGTVVAALLIVFAPACVGLFLPNAGATRTAAILGLRLFAVGLIPCCVNTELKNLYLGTERVYLTEIFSLIEGTVLPALVAFVFSRFMGVTGAWLYFLLGEALALLGLCGKVWLRAGRVSLSADDFLMLNPDFGVPPEALLERDIGTIAEVADVARAAQAFCLAHGQDERTSGRIALCIEEMAANTVEHGFARGSKNHLSVRILNKGDRWVLRFRDDCTAFDPMNYVPRTTEGSDLGIRLVTAMADEIRYTYSLNLNNLTLIFHGGKMA